METRSHLACDIHSSALDEFAVQVKPVFAKEHQFARAFEILESNDTPGLVVFAKARLYACDDTAQRDVLTVEKCRTTFCQFGTTCIAKVVEHDFIFVQRMCRQVDAHQFALFVQTFDVAPTHIGLRNSRCLNGNGTEIAE